MKTPLTFLWVYNIKENKIQLSDSFLEMFHYEHFGVDISVDELFSKMVYDSEKEELLNQFKDFISKPFQFGRSLSIEFRKKCKKNVFKHFKMIVLHTSEDNISVCIEDISVYKENEQQLLNANKNLEAISNQLEGIVENTKNGVVVYRAIDNGKDFIITGFNRAASRIDQVSSVKIIGRKISEVFPRFTEFGTVDVLKQVWKTGKPKTLPLKYYQTNRNEGWREAYIFKIKTGEVVAIYNDLSELLIKQGEARKYKTVVDQSVNPIVITNIDGRIEYVNKRFCEFYGYDEKEVIGENPRIIKSGNQPDNVYIDLWSTLLKGDAWSGEFENKCKDGSLVWVRATISPIYDQQNNIISLLGIQEDITEKRETEQLLKFSENKMRNIFSTMDDTVVQINKEGVFTYIAPTNSQDLFINAEDLPGKNINEIFPKKNADLFMSFLEEVFTTDKTILKEYSLNIKNDIQWFEARLSPVSHNEAIVIIRNISQRKEAIERLKTSELKFRRLFEHSGDAILLIKNGRFFECNQAALNMLGYDSKEQLIFKNPDDISPLLQADGATSTVKAKEMMQLAIEKGSHRFEWHHTKSDGHIFPVEVLLTAAKDNDGEMVLHTVWRDITDQKNKEKEILESKEKAVRADKFKSAFLANMSHEIRTPMNGIIGFAELLGDPDLNEEEKESFIQIIRRSGMNMLNIINDILDISKIEAGEVELSLAEHNVTETLNYLYDFFNPEINKKEINWVKEYQSDQKIYINIDQFKFNELLTNLIKNAIKYTHNGSVNIGVKERDDDLLFYIKDTGIGIPYEKQDQIFDRFIQADNDITHMVYGTGLGLSISKAYVEMHKGNIWLDSIPGKGSTFYFTIPKNLKTKESKPLVRD